LETFVLFRALVTRIILVSILVLPEISGVRLLQVALSEELTCKFDNKAIKDMKYHEEEPLMVGEKKLRVLCFFCMGEQRRA
jgi:hypothetical protein